MPTAKKDRVKRVRLRWRDGREFVGSVKVLNWNGVLICHLHASQASALCMQGTAAPEKRGKRIWCIMLRPMLAKRIGDPRPLSVHSYGNRMTYLQVLGRVDQRRMTLVQFKHLDAMPNCVLPACPTPPVQYN